MQQAIQSMLATRLAIGSRSRPRAAFLAVVALALFHVGGARAVPAFARQTQLPCAACHVGAFGPQLTPFGRQFKLLGYTLKTGNGATVPLSAMLVETFTHTAKAQADVPADGFKRNNNSELQQASLFVAGRLTEHMGLFSQVTYEQNGGLVGWDNVDLRYARTFTRGSHAGIWGMTLNNNPTLTDVFNTAPAWQFPYMAPDLAPSAPAAPILLGGLSGQVAGASAYAQLDGAWYLEAGGYRSLSPGFLRRVNADYDGRLAGVAPYARVNRSWNAAGGNLEVGAFYLEARRGSVGENAAGQAIPLPGPTDRFRDVGVDASYQRVGDVHTVTVNALYVGERQQLDASVASGDASHRHNTLDALNLNGSYWYRDTWGATLAWFRNDGSADQALYGDNRRPSTDGGMLELDWNPLGHAGSPGSSWTNVRIGVQYTFYDRFAGSVHNIDGAGRRASDNNTSYAYIWLAF